MKKTPKFYKRLVVNIDEPFHYLLKMEALKKNMTLSHYVLRSLRQQLELETAREKYIKTY